MTGPRQGPEYKARRGPLSFGLTLGPCCSSFCSPTPSVRHGLHTISAKVMYCSLCLGLNWACRQFWPLSGWGPQFHIIPPGLPGQARQVQSRRDRTWLYLLVDAADWLLSCLPTAGQARVWLKAVTLREGFHRRQSVADPGCGIDGLCCQIRGTEYRVGDSGAVSSPNANRLQSGPVTGPQGWGADCGMVRAVPMHHHALRDMGYRRPKVRHVRCRCSLSAQFLVCQCPRVLEL